MFKQRQLAGVGIGLAITSLAAGIYLAKPPKPSFTDLQISSSSSISPDLHRLVISNKNNSFGFRSDRLQHLLIKDQAQISRMYTPINIQPDSFDLIVKNYTSGYMSPKLALATPTNNCGLEAILIDSGISLVPNMRIRGECHGTGVLPFVQMHQKQPLISLDLFYTNQTLNFLLPHKDNISVHDFNSGDCSGPDILMVSGSRQFAKQFTGHHIDLNGVY